MYTDVKDNGGKKFFIAFKPNCNSETFLKESPLLLIMKSSGGSIMLVDKITVTKTRQFDQNLQ